MKIRFLLPTFVLLLFAILSSRCSDSIIAPDNKNNLIPNPSFELNGVSSAAFWSVNMPSLVNFTNDTPQGGGNWAVTIDVLWGSGNDVITTILIPEGTHIYQFSFWSKYSSKPGYAEILLSAQDSLSQINRIIVDSRSWKKYSILDTITSVSSDSLQIKLSGGYSNLLPGETYFDLCTLELLE